jgi:quinol-cytochrome oxidoreductase complex cytochrome b subunit
LTRSVVRSALLAVVAFVLTTAPAFAQSVIPSPAVTVGPAKPAPPWTFYMAILTIAIAALTLIMALVGYLVQAPGFRKKQTPAQPTGQAS